MDVFCSTVFFYRAENILVTLFLKVSYTYVLYYGYINIPLPSAITPSFPSEPLLIPQWLQHERKSYPLLQ